MTRHPGGLAEALAGQVDGEVRFDAGSRGAYATDASNYRQVPLGVVVPRSVGAAVAALDTGCCGLAGNFGFERGHYEVSAACAERGLWPAARSADPGTVILADGFSCRTQLAAGRTGRQGLHLAQLLARLTDGDRSSGSHTATARPSRRRRPLAHLGNGDHPAQLPDD